MNKPTPIDEEIVLDPRRYIVSETDEKGKITFCNDYFIEVSGYTKEELIGKPHSIVRHPDMPKAAFKGLWDTVKSGKVGDGYVKNKTKDGGYYWVYATVYPTYDEVTRVKTYMSCRRKPSAEEIAESEALYKTLN